MEMLSMSVLCIHFWLDARFVKKEVIVFKIGLLKRIIERATDRGIMICLENLSESASHMRKPFHELPSLNLTLDLGHAQLMTETNRSYGFMEQFPERIRHIHLHDNRGGHSYRDDLHLPLGEGIIDFKDILKNLKRIGYDRTVTLELRLPEIKKNLEYVKELLFSDQGIQP